MSGALPAPVQAELPAVTHTPNRTPTSTLDQLPLPAWDLIDITESTAAAWDLMDSSELTPRVQYQASRLMQQAITFYERSIQQQPSEPYSQIGWLYAIETGDAKEFDGLKDAQSYSELIQAEAH